MTGLCVEPTPAGFAEVEERGNLVRASSPIHLRATPTSQRTPFLLIENTSAAWKTPDAGGAMAKRIVGTDLYLRLVRRSRQACSQRRQTSAQMRQCSCMSAWLSHSSPHALQVVAQASTSVRVTLHSYPVCRDNAFPVAPQIPASSEARRRGKEGVST